MILHSMTATFGKLDNEKLQLKPGLNVIHAPNEWGKSTWCAFLCAMLYGIDTKQRSGKGLLPDKERYAPWSGKPMSGRIDLCWKGRNITIERSTKGRLIFGQFRAYETETGLPVSQLTAENCGQMLLGVEKSVFTRTGFIRFSDLPVTEDEALRRRLNALVTTGDESGASDALAKKLRELKNACRHNTTGKLPKARQQRQQLKEELIRLHQLQAQQKELTAQHQALEQKADALRNHLSALAYADARNHLQKLAQAEASLSQAQQQLAAETELCKELPSAAVAEHQLEALEYLSRQLDVLQTRELALPLQPEPPRQSPAFYGMDPRQAEDKLRRDLAAYRKLTSKKKYIPAAIFAALGIGAGAYLLLCMPGLTPAILKWLPLLAVLPLLVQLLRHAGDNSYVHALAETYGSRDPSQWQNTARQHEDALREYEEAMNRYRQQREQLAREKEALLESRKDLTNGEPLSSAIARLERALQQKKQLLALQLRCEQLEDTVQTLRSVTLQATPPAQEDTLTLTREQTREALAETEDALNRLQLSLGQVQGQAQALGSEEALVRECRQLDEQILRLEEMYQALTLAQETLAEAANALQRQFAPRITAAAKEYFRQLTGGRYDRLILDEDLSLMAAAREETGLQPGKLRSDGTIDQLYLSLRLAAAGELLPEAPLILDDALVRFDDIRLGYALQLMKQQAKSRQVLIFTCQKREQEQLGACKEL